MFSSTLIKGIGCETWENFAFMASQDSGEFRVTFFAHFERSSLWRHLLPSHVLESIDCTKISVRRKWTAPAVKWIGDHWSVSMTSQRIVFCRVAAVNTTYRNGMAVVSACSNVCFSYIFFSFSISLSGHDLGFLFWPAIVKL